jgi:HSP20 family protein
MSLTPREASGGFTSLRDAMNRLFEESFIGPRFELFGGRAFPLDVYETPDQQQYVVEAALPGFKPEEMQITAEGDTLTIRTTRKGEEKVEKGNYVRREFYMGEMSRSVALPTPIDPSKVDASYEHGILTVRVPKAQGAQPKRIPVKVKEVVSAK